MCISETTYFCFQKGDGEEQIDYNTMFLSKHNLAIVTRTSQTLM